MGSFAAPPSRGRRNPNPGYGVRRVPHRSACRGRRIDRAGSAGDPGHEIVGRVEELGEGVEGFRLGERVGVPWLGWTCGVCPYCAIGHENLCDRPLFNGYTRDGGFATEVIADARYSFDLGEDGDDAASHRYCVPASLVGAR